MSVLGDIGSQAIVVLKHFTPSTFDPWKGAVVSTFVDTYGQTVFTDCDVTSSTCNAVISHISQTKLCVAQPILFAPAVVAVIIADTL